MTSTKIIGGTDYNYINALTDVFYYKKSLISYIIASIVISKAFNIFGNNGGIISLIIVLLIYFKILKIPLFNSPELDPSKFGDLSDYIMAEKSCGVVSTLNNDIPTKIKKLKKNSVVVQETDTPDIKENDLTNSESLNSDLVPISRNISNIESETNTKIEPVVESQIEPVVESQVEPVVESQLEPVVESQVEPVLESQVEPVLESQVEPVLESQVEPTSVESQVEPTSVESQVEPVLESQVEPTSVESQVEPTSVESQVEPVVESQVEPVVESQVEPVLESQVEPTSVESQVEPTSVENEKVLPN